MSDEIEYVSNVNDLSTDRGFQFELECNRCGSGFRTPFKAWSVGTAASVLDAASSLLGGRLFNSAADMGERGRSAAWQKAHDQALAEAIESMRPNFVQCPRCSSWVCRKGCWNERKGLCKECAPDLGVEMSAAQASRSVEEVWAHAAMAEEDKKLGKEHWRKNIRATCPKCGKAMPANVKFCPECGARVQDDKYCSECGAKLLPGAKFCGECGAKTA